jgi:hypothetical protein
MKLSAVIDTIGALTEDLCIVAKRPWSADCEVALVQMTDPFRVPQSLREAGYEYFLEVTIVREEVLHGASWLTPEQRVEAVLYYAENDAYPDWLNELAREWREGDATPRDDAV